MTTPHIAVIGNGKMGTAIAQMIHERGWQVSAMLDGSHNRNGDGISKRSLGHADVAIEFTEPGSAVKNIMACISDGIPVVVGTTGWYDSLPLVTAAAIDRGGALLWAPNFSIGVALFTEIARQAARLMAATPDFAAHLVETHHSAKKDAPSGTALAIIEAMKETSGRTIPVTSVRTGSVPGTHELIFDGPFEQISMRHEARDRRVFADGALRAAQWLIGKKGVFTMRDVLGFSDPKQREGGA